MCHQLHAVQFDPHGGPILLDIKSGFATKGKYHASIRLEDGWKTFGTGDITDEIPDVLVVPLDGEELNEKRILLIGKFSPGNLAVGAQISVRYSIIQGAEVLHRGEVEEEKAGVLLCTHSFRFEVPRSEG